VKRFFVGCVVVFSLFGCGGSSNSTVPSGPVDALSFVTDDAFAIVAFDLVALRRSHALLETVATSLHATAADLSFIHRCDSMWYAYAGPSNRSYALFDCRDAPSDERESIVRAATASDSVITSDASGIVIVSPPGDTDPARIVPRRQSSPLVAAMRRTWRRAGNSAQVSFAFIPTDAMRASFGQSELGADAGDAVRQFLARVAAAPRDITGFLAVEGDRLASTFVVSTLDEEEAQFLEGFLIAAREAPAEEEPGDDALDAMMASLFQDLVVRREGASVVATHEFDGLDARLAVVVDAFLAHRSETTGETPRVANDQQSRVDQAMQRGDYGAVIAEVEPELSAIVNRLPDDPASWGPIGWILEAYLGAGRSLDVVALVASIEEAYASRRLEVPSVEHAFARMSVARALELRGDLASALAEFDRSLASLGEATGVDAIESVTSAGQYGRAMVLAKLGRLDEALASIDRSSGARPVASTREEALGQSDEDYARWLVVENNRAWVAFLARRPDVGLPRIESVIRAIDTRPIDSASQATYFDTHANLLFLTGRFEEAARAHRDELDASGEAYGLDHPYRALGLYSIARVEVALHHGEKAVRYARQAVALLERTVTRSHPDTAIAHLRLAEALAEAGQGPEAHAEAALAVELFHASTVAASVERREAETFLTAHPGSGVAGVRSHP